MSRRRSTAPGCARSRSTSCWTSWERRRAEVVAWLRELTPEQLGRTGQHEVAGEISIADLLHHLAYHDLEHVEQAARMLHGHYEPLRGGMRAF